MKKLIGAALMLVFIGIHNAWDTVMYITVEGRPGSDAPEEAPAGRSRPVSAPESGVSSTETPGGASEN